MKVAVVGASGHTGRFVVEELMRRGLAPVAVVRSEQRLRERGIDPQVIETRVASLGDPASLDRAFVDASAVVNCAGPFLDTAQSVVEAALRAGAHYFDLTAEQGSAQQTLATYDSPARARGTVVLPAAGFYGALADLLATATLGDWTKAAEIRTLVALDHWWPTRGTRQTGQRNTLPRFAMRNGQLEAIAARASTTWQFPNPFGAQAVVELPFSETILMARHLKAAEIRHFITEASLNDIRDATTPEPAAADERGRSSQTFLMESVVRNDSQTRRLVARGRDIYAISAPIVVEAVDRVLRGEVRQSGAFAPAELFDATDFLRALSSHDLTVSEN